MRSFPVAFTGLVFLSCVRAAGQSPGPSPGASPVVADFLLKRVP